MGKAIAAMVLGILSIWLWPIGIILGPIALAFGIRSQLLLRRRPGLWRGKGFAIAGTATGAVGTIFSLGLVSLFIAIIATGGFNEDDEGYDVQSVEGSIEALNLDADGAREVVVVVRAYAGERGEALDFAGVATARVESSSDGLEWQVVGFESATARPTGMIQPQTEVHFLDLHFDPGLSYRAHVEVSVEATGFIFEDDVPATGAHPTPP